jgi:hypothetical protein
MPDPFMTENRAPIISAAARNNVPAVYSIQTRTPPFGGSNRIKGDTRSIPCSWNHTAETDCVAGHIGLRCAKRKFISLNSRQCSDSSAPTQAVLSSQKNNTKLRWV